MFPSISIRNHIFKFTRYTYIYFQTHLYLLHVIHTIFAYFQDILYNGITSTHHTYHEHIFRFNASAPSPDEVHQTISFECISIV